jgi:hypothetical protein
MLNGQVYDAKTRTNISNHAQQKEKMIKWALRMQNLGHFNHKNTIVDEGQ